MSVLLLFLKPTREFPKEPFQLTIFDSPPKERWPQKSSKTVPTTAKIVFGQARAIHLILANCYNSPTDG